MQLKIKSRNAVLTDIINEAKRFPKGWKAAFGKDTELPSHDYYIFNPNVGVYLLKEYQKNPFETKGVGAKIARQIDDDIEKSILKTTGDFGIVQGNMRKILRSVKRGVPPERIFDAALKGEDLGIRIPVQGHASSSKDAFMYLKNTWSTKQKSLDAHLEKMIADDGIYTSYG